ncbi:MAG: trypsin-like serine protease [Dehalococcoidia bacterium]|nr:MAG: trypsin-like serine protease [Dehalococcoidia bacterium]
MTNTNGWRISAIAGIVVAAMLIGGAVALSAFGGHTITTITPSGARVTQPVQQASLPTAGGIADVVARVRPSVVLIEGSTQGTAGTSSGTGMVIDREGRILTNYHVIEGQKDIKVTLADGTAAKATVVGSDPGSDLAVIKVNVASNLLAPVAFADSDSVRAGDSVFAIGNPFNQNFSVSAGIISATGRVTTSSFTGRAIRDVMQTDTAMNPGNSGGPLFNLKGEVVGVNSSIENPSGRFFVGLGYAIPSNTAQRFLPAMIQGKDIQHPQLGVSVAPLDEVVAANLGLTVTRGVYVTSVTPSGAAARAGIVAASRGTNAQTAGRGGDVITAVGGQPVRNFEELARAIDKNEVGAKVQIDLVRNGQPMSVTAELQLWDLR